MKAFILSHWNSNTTRLGVAVVCASLAGYLTQKMTIQQAIISAVIGLVSILSKDHGK